MEVDRDGLAVGSKADSVECRGEPRRPVGSLGYGKAGRLAGLERGDERVVGPREGLARPD